VRRLLVAKVFMVYGWGRPPAPDPCPPFFFISVNPCNLWTNVFSFVQIRVIRGLVFVWNIFSFEFWICFGFRISCFGFISYSILNPSMPSSFFSAGVSFGMREVIDRQGRSPQVTAGGHFFFIHEKLNWRLPKRFGVFFKGIFYSYHLAAAEIAVLIGNECPVFHILTFDHREPL